MKYPADRILLIATRQIGDVLLVTPLLRSLRRAYPRAVIDVLAYENKEGMLAGNPDLNEVITVAEHPGAREYLALLRRILRRYDLAISILSGDRPLVYALLAARRRVALVPPRRWQDAWKRLAMHAWTELDNETTHTVVQNLRLADLLGIARCYEVVVPRAEDAEVVLDALLPFPWRTEGYAVLHLLPMWRYKRWTLAGWARLARYLADAGLRVVLTGGGGQEEGDYLGAARQGMPASVVNLAGRLRFGDVAALIGAAKVYVGPDTAVTHLAAATGTPTVAVYGPTNPLKWGLWPQGYAGDAPPLRRKGTQRVGNVVLVQGEGPCVPCHQEGCDRHKQSRSRCLEELDSAKVIGAVQELMMERGSTGGTSPRWGENKAATRRTPQIRRQE